MDPVIVAALIGGGATVVAAVIAAIAGRSWGRRGKKRAFDHLQTELSLDKTTWRGEFEDLLRTDETAVGAGTIEFRQFGSRIAGEGRSAEGTRKWLVEGLAYKGRLCYVYADADPNVVSIGTASFELQPSGDVLEGRWTGWSPDGQSFDPRPIVLTRIKK